MLLLTSTSDKLQVVTGSACTIDVHASWMDNVAGAVAPGRTNTNITTAATTDAVGSPAASTQRNIKTLHIRNRGAASCDVTVQHTDGTIISQLHKTAILPGNSLQYIDEIGFVVPPLVSGGGGGGGSASGGRLRYSGTTSCLFERYNGGSIWINKQPYLIPAVGVNCGNTGVNINGTLGASLAANTAYLVGLYLSAGVLTPYYDNTLVHAPSTTVGNESTEIIVGDDTISLIGMVRTNASSQFVNTPKARFVRSWFNRRALRLRADYVASHSAAPYTGWLEVSTESRVEWLNWADENILLGMTGAFSSSFITAFYTAMMMDGVFDANPQFVVSNYGDAYTRGINAASNFEPSEGYHYGNFGAQISDNVTCEWRNCSTVGEILS